MTAVFLSEVLYAAIAYTLAQHRRERASDPCPNQRCEHPSDGHCRLATLLLCDGLAWAYNARLIAVREA